MLPALTSSEWCLAALAAFCIGLSKCGFAGVGLVTVVLMARVFPPRESTGVLLPLLICGDVLSVIVFHQHANWRQIGRMLPPTIIGIAAGYFLMLHIPGETFGPVIGGIVLVMVLLQLIRKSLPDAYVGIPHTRGFAWFMGAWSGVATMIANAAGPVMALYFLAIDLPKYALVGTSAWFFLLVNVSKVPLSANLGLITDASLLFNLLLVGPVALGIATGRHLIRVLPQKLFEQLLLAVAAVVALKLIGAF